MLFRRLSPLFYLLVALLLALRAAPVAAGPLVLVGVPPIAYLVQQIGGSQVTVQSLVAAGQDPHNFTLSPRRVAQLTQAQLYLSMNLFVERAWVPKLQAVNSKLQVKSLLDSATASAECDDPHLWTSPKMALVLARSILAQLEQYAPEHAALYRRNAATLKAQLQQLDRQLTESWAPIKGYQFFVYHPGFGALARDYGLQQVALEQEGKGPLAQEMTAFIDTLQRQGVRAVIVQPQFHSPSVRRIVEIVGAAQVEIDPLASDYYERLPEYAEQIKAAAVKARTVGP